MIMTCFAYISMQLIQIILTQIIISLPTGLPNSGKTLLLRSLSSYPKPIEKFDTVATVGINVVHLNHPNSNQSFTIREIGGQMKPIWSTYFNKSMSAILFTIDCSNPVEIGPNVVTLLDIFRSLSAQAIKPKVLIILTKSDYTGPLKLRDVINGLLLDDLINSKILDENSTKVIECSSINGQGLNDILEWVVNYDNKAT